MRTASADSVSCDEPSTAAKLTTAPFFVCETFVTLEASLKERPCFSNIFWKREATSVSKPVKIRSRYSMITTSEPSRRQTEPSSNPITPAPIMMSFSGTFSNASAPVDESIIFSSFTISAPEASRKDAGEEPVAITMFLVSKI